MSNKPIEELISGKTQITNFDVNKKIEVSDSKVLKKIRDLDASIRRNKETQLKLENRIKNMDPSDHKNMELTLGQITALHESLNKLRKERVKLIQSLDLGI